MLLEILIPALDLHAELDFHFLLGENESRSSYVLETRTQRHVIANVICQIWDKVLQIGRIPMNRELDIIEITVWNIDRDLVLTENDIENIIEDLCANLVLKRLIAREFEVTQLIVN